MNNLKTENITSVSSYTLRELIEMSGAEIRSGILGECTTMTNDTRFDAFEHPSRIDAFIIGVGVSGQGHIAFNLKEYDLQANTLFVFSPKNILQTRSKSPFTAQVLVFTPDFLRMLNVDTKHMMPLFMEFAAHPLLNLTEEESRTIREYMTLIERELASEDSDFLAEIVSAVVVALIYKIGDIVHRNLSAHPEIKPPVYNRSEEYFRQFMALLSDHYKHERSVGYYAQQLCITPKYLTTIIKRISSRSVSEWIDYYVVLEAKMLLKYTNKSIQEVAYELNFPNQSFFGCYFKRNTGFSPSQYKAKL